MLFSAMPEFYHWLALRLSICDYNLGDETSDIPPFTYRNYSITFAQRMCFWWTETIQVTGAIHRQQGFRYDGQSCPGLGGTIPEGASGS